MGAIHAVRRRHVTPLFSCLSNSKKPHYVKRGRNACKAHTEEQGLHAATAGRRSSTHTEATSAAPSAPSPSPATGEAGFQAQEASTQSRNGHARRRQRVGPARLQRRQLGRRGRRLHSIAQPCGWRAAAQLSRVQAQSARCDRAAVACRRGRGGGGAAPHGRAAVVHDLLRFGLDGQRGAGAAAPPDEPHEQQRREEDRGWRRCARRPASASAAPQPRRRVRYGEGARSSVATAGCQRRRTQPVRGRFASSSRRCRCSGGVPQEGDSATAAAGG